MTSFRIKFQIENKEYHNLLSPGKVLTLIITINHSLDVKTQN